MKVFPLLSGHQHMPLQYRNKISASETVCELRFCVLSRKRILLLYSLKSFLRPVLACMAIHRSRQKKPLHFANWISIHDGIHELLFLKKMESYLFRYDDQLSLTHLVAQTEVVHSIVQILWTSFSFLL